MKKTLFCICCCFWAAIVSICVGLAYHKYIEPTPTDEDSMYFYVEPVFNTPAEVLDFYNDNMNAFFNDSVFYSIPAPTLQQIASVVIGKIGSATEKDIVVEYLKNWNNVYKYLEVQDTLVLDPPIPPLIEETVRLPNSTSDTEDTIIDGIKYKRL